MRDTTGWFRCIHCGHLVNPRSERCQVPHDLCTPTGCEPPPAAELHALVADPAAPADTVLRAFAAAATGTLYLFDVASYQAGIDLDVVAAAGWDIANVKTSQGTWYTFGDALMYAKAAKARGLGVSTFHWLDNTASGRAQADYAWRTLGPIIAAVGPVAHIVDEEDSAAPASYQHLADYVTRINELMGHLPAMYTGDWYATSGGRAGWNVAALTPWLMSAPNAGYLGSYPGDQSPHWGAGYWGYPDLAAMQFAVSPIPGAGGGSISKTALRDPAVWAAITGGETDVALKDETIKGSATPGMGDRDAATMVLDIWLAVTQGKMSGGGLWDSSPFAQLLADAGKPPVAPVALSDADKAAIVADLAALLPLPPTAAEVAEELAKRLGNG